MRTVSIDPGRHLDHVVGAKPGERLAVADVDDLDVARAVMEGGEQLRGCLAVEGASTVVEQRRFRVERRVGVHVEQLALEPHDLLGPTVTVPLLGEHLVEGVVVAQVVGGHRAQLAEPCDRHLEVTGDRLSIAGEQLREPILAIDPRGGDPAEVVQPDVVEREPIGVDAETLRQTPLQRDGHVAEAQRTVALIGERLAHDADRVGEVDDPGAGSGPTANELRELEDDRHRSQRLGKSTGPGRLLADGAEAKGERLVEESRRLPSDSELDEDEVRAVHGRVGVTGQGEAPVPLHPLEHAAGQPADDLAAVGIDVVEDQLVDRQPGSPARKPLDQLRRIGAPTADDGDLDTHQILDRVLTHCL